MTANRVTTLDEFGLGDTPETWLCVDCGIDTAPSNLNRSEVEAALEQVGGFKYAFHDRCEVYAARDRVWEEAGMERTGGCLCVGCIERRLGRKLRPKDFKRDDPLNGLPGTPRLRKRRKD